MIKMAKKKKVTVLLTVYNRKSVKNTIDSILNQSFENFELLIIDNASDDGTFELLMEYSEQDERVTVVRNEKNMGQTYSLHKGMDIAQGEYIARIDADDLMIRDRLEKQVAFLDENPEYGLCGTWVQFITDDDRLAFLVRMPSTDSGFRTVQRVSCGAYHPSVMMRKETLDKYKIKYNEKLLMAEDYDMWRQIAKVSKVMNIPEALTLYRRGTNNDSEKNRDITRKEDVLVRHIVSEEEEYEGKYIMEQILSIEERSKKSLVLLFHTYRLYIKYLDLNLSKDDLDYGIAKERIKSRLLGEFFIYNDTVTAHIGKMIYSFLRKARYKLAN